MITYKIELLEQKYTLPKHLDVSSRVSNYWKKNAILPFFQAHKKGKMNIPQAIWFCIVKELSEFGVNSTKLSELAYSVWRKPYKEDYLKIKIEAEISYLENNITEDENIKKLKKILNDPKRLETYSQEITPFSDAIIDCIVTNKEPLSIYYFYKSDECYLHNETTAMENNLINLKITEPYICIPLLPFIGEVLSIEIEDIKKDLLYLSEIENEIRTNIILNSNKYIELIMNNDSIKPIINKEDHKKAKQLADFFLNNKLTEKTKLVTELLTKDQFRLNILTK